MIKKVFISLFLFVSFSVLAEKTEEVKTLAKIFVGAIETSGSDVSLDLQVQNAPKDQFDLRFYLDGKRHKGVKARKRPVNLWVLMDSSAVCQAFQFDKFGKNVVSLLKKSLHKDSVVSIISYRRGKQFDFHNHRPISAITDVLNFECESSGSESYEQALRGLLKEKNKSNLPTYLWVFSSGNALISKSLSQEMKKKKIHTHLFVYLTGRELAPVVKASNRLLGADLFSFHQAKVEDLLKIIPANFYDVKVGIPRALRGENRDLKIEVVSKEQAIAEKSFKVLVERGKFFDLIQNIIYAVYALALLLVFYFIYRFIKHFLPSKCMSCGAYKRHKDEFCLSCEKGIQGWLIIEPKFGESPHPIVKPFGDKGAVKIGTSPRCKIELEKGPSGQDLVYFTLNSESLRVAGRAIYIEPNQFQKNLNMRINGALLQKKRYISSGDTLSVPGYDISLFINREDHAS
jgi:hypothetical protein